MIKRYLLFLAALSIIPHGAIPAANAQAAPVEVERGIVALDQALRDLSNPYTVMCIATHPDDADYSTLALYRKRLGARTVIVFATRGESRESPTGLIDEELGVLNTRQALEAARIVGADVYFLNLRDFGLSKSADEALGIWNHDEALARLVRAIRLLRPDVIITRHKPRTGAGQQQAVSKLLYEAYEASADAQRFQEADKLTWQVRRIFEKSEESEAAVSINTGEYNEIRGVTYAEIGRKALAQISIFEKRDRDQAGEKVYYSLARSAADDKLKPGATLLDGLALPDKLAQSIAPPRVGDLSALEAIARREPLIASLTERLIEKRAEGSPAEMRERYGNEFFRMILFIGALERAIAIACGLSFEIRLDDRLVVPGQSVTARLQLRNGSNQRFPATFHLPETLTAGEQAPLVKRIDSLDLTPGGTVTREVSYEAPRDGAVTLPHSSQLYKESYYPIGSSIPGSLTHNPFGVRLLATAEVGVGLTSITIPALVRFDISRPVEITTKPFLLLKDWEAPRKVEVALRLVNRTKGELDGALWAVPLALVQDDYEPLHIKFSREDEVVIARLKLDLPVAKPPLSPDVLIEFRREKPAPQDAIGSFTIKVKAINAEATENLEIGYIPGPSSWIPFALEQLGVSYSEMLLSSIKTVEQGSAELVGRPRRVCGDLTRFKTIIVGDRALSFRDELPLLGGCLLEYVRRGGNLVFFYQRAEDWGVARERREIAPFPLRLGEEHITGEAAAVKILEKDHPLLTRPNAITAEDFSGWVNHRALYLPKEWDGQYKALLESNDPGQEPQRGGLLVAKYGEGTYVFISYDLGRQLLALNPGAFRLFANIISQ